MRDTMRSEPNLIVNFENNLTFIRISYKEGFFRKTRFINIPKSMIVDFFYKQTFIGGDLTIILKSSNGNYKIVYYRTHWIFKNIEPLLNKFMKETYTQYNPDAGLKHLYKQLKT